MQHRTAMIPKALRTLLPVALLAALLSSGCFIGPPELSASQKAQSFLTNDQPQEAIAICTPLLHLTDDESLNCRFALAVAYNHIEEFEQAIQIAQDLIEATDRPRLKAATYAEVALSRLEIAKQLDTDPLPAKIAAYQDSVDTFRQSLVIAEQNSLDFLDVRMRLTEALVGLMIYSKNWSLDSEIKEILTDYLAAKPQGSLADWARKLSCSSERYESLRVDAAIRTSTEDPVPDESMALSASEPPNQDPGTAQLDTAQSDTAQSDTAQPATVQPPRRLSSPAPQYSELARQTRIQGTVVIQAVIDENGEVTKTRPLERLPFCLTEEALLVVQEWTFEPAKINGKPESVFYNLSVNFELEANPSNG